MRTDLFASSFFWMILAVVVSCSLMQTDLLSQSISPLKGTQFQSVEIDPENIHSTFAHLLNRSVRKELKVSEDYLDRIKELLEDGKGSLNVVVIPPAVRKLGKEAVMAYFEEKQRLRAEAIQDILDPLQQRRLVEVSYQIEIIEKGVAGAITNGFAGKKIGFSDYQRQAFDIRETTVEKQYFQEYIKAKQKYFDDIGSILGEDHSRTFANLVGRPYNIKKFTVPGRSRNGSSIPNLDSAVGILSLLSQREIRILFPEFDQDYASILKSVQAADDGYRLIANKLQLNKLSLTEAQEQENTIKRDLLLIIPEDKLVAISNAGWQLELSRFGVLESLRSGRLSGKFLFSSDWLLNNAEKLKSVQEIFEKSEGALIWRKTQVLLEELTPLQRDQLNTCLGEPFTYSLN